jgi:hypothetical protein
LISASRFIRKETAVPQRLKTCLFWVALFGTAEAVPFPVKVKGKVKGKIKSVGQERPTHMVTIGRVAHLPRSLRKGWDSTALNMLAFDLRSTIHPQGNCGLLAAEAELTWVALFGTAEAVPFPVKVKGKVKGKIKVKSVGQECPSHMVTIGRVAHLPRSLRGWDFTARNVLAFDLRMTIHPQGNCGPSAAEAAFILGGSFRHG